MTKRKIIIRFIATAENIEDIYTLAVTRTTTSVKHNHNRYMLGASATSLQSWSSPKSDINFLALLFGIGSCCAMSGH